MRRGDIWICDLRLWVGREISKKRPALVISENAINEISTTVIIIPISSQVPEILGPERILLLKTHTNLTKDSVLLTAQVRAVDKTWFIKKIGSLFALKLLEVEESLRIVLGMSDE